MLELDLEQPDDLDGQPGGARDADAGELVGREDLLDVALGDDVAHGRSPVTRHDDAAGEGRRDDRRAVRCVEGAAEGQVARTGQQVRGVAGQELGEATRCPR